MCTFITFPDRGVWSQEELAEIIGRENIVFRDPDDTFEAEDCLCAVDVRATLERRGIRYEYDSGFDIYRVLNR